MNTDAASTALTTRRTVPAGQSMPAMSSPADLGLR